MGKRIVVSTNGARIIGYPHAKMMNIDPYFQHTQKLTQKVSFINSDVRGKTINL